MVDVHSPATKTILVIEDSTTQALHLRTLLEGEGARVLWAPNGPEGLQIARQAHPDLIVLDLQMPEMDGFQVCQHLKRIPKTADIPIIIFTHRDDVASIIAGLKEGVIDYIPKDAFADAVLLETLRQLGFIAARNVAYLG